jgi:hypothetical protein
VAWAAYPPLVKESTLGTFYRTLRTRLASFKASGPATLY